MKNVVLFTEQFNNGGIERVIYDIYTRIDKEQFNPKIVAFTADTKLYNDINIVSLLKQKHKKSLSRKIEGIKKLKQFLKNEKIDVLHINTYNSIGLVYAHIAYKLGIKTIILHAHSSNINNDFLKIKLLINNIIKWRLKSNKYIYLSASTQCGKFCFSRGTKIISIPNEINVEKFKYNEDIRKNYREKFSFKEDDLVVGNIGRFAKEKNHRFLIKVFEKIHNIKPNSYLVLIGNGKLKTKIQKDIAKRNLNKNVIFLENRNDISKLMQMLDIYVSTSIYEGFGLTLLEAQAASLRCFCSDSIPVEVRQTKTLYMISLKENSTYWADTILKNSRYTRKNIEMQDNMNNYIKKIEEIYCKQNI